MAFSYDEGLARQAQPTWYNGVKYRSKLEAKTAQALDNIGMPYVYEPDGYKLTNGMWYRPDFWLTEAHQFIECKGSASNEDMAKVVGLVEDVGYPVLIMSYDNAMLVMRFWNYPNDGIVTYGGQDIALCDCGSCGGKWFLATEDTYACQCCGFYDGGHFFDCLYPLMNGTEFFRYGQSVAASDPKYSELAERFNNN